MKRKLTLIIVDDQQSAIDHALSAIRPFIDLSVKDTFTDPVAALEFLGENHVDFVLLDVDMPTVNGMAFMMQMPPEVKVVFCTAHEQYAVAAFEYQAVDYLMRPVTAGRFAKSIARMKKELRVHVESPHKTRADYYYFMLKGPVRFQRTKVDFAELVYIEARGRYTYFHLIGDLKKENGRQLDLRETTGASPYANHAKRDKGKYEGVPCLQGLQELNEIVHGSSLMQIHKSYILNTDYFRGYLSRTVALKGLEAITVPTGLRRNFPEFFDFLDSQHTPGHD